MKTHHRLDVTLTLLGPILTRGGMMAEPGIDAPLARDGFRRPMLPFSLIKGKIRDAFRALLPARIPVSTPGWARSARLSRRIAASCDSATSSPRKPGKRPTG